MPPPRKELPLDIIEELAALGMSGRSIAAKIGVSEATIRRRCDAVLAKAAATREEKLLRLQWALAEKGHVAMLIFLGKAILGQSESGPQSPDTKKQDKAVLRIVDVKRKTPVPTTPAITTGS